MNGSENYKTLLDKSQFGFLMEQGHFCLLLTCMACTVMKLNFIIYIDGVKLAIRLMRFDTIGWVTGTTSSL